MGLAPGYLSDRALGQQGIHDQNAYTGRKDTLIEGRIAVNTAYALRSRYPQLKGYADKLFAKGLALMLNHYGAIDEADRMAIRRYFSTAHPSTSLYIGLASLKHSLQNLVGASGRAQSRGGQR